MKTLALSLALVGCVGCSSIDYVPYAGQQQLWPTKPGSLVRQVHGLEVYYGPPYKPYTLVGRVVGVDAGEAELVRVARAHGADAVLLTDCHTQDGGTAFLPGVKTTTTGPTVSTTYSTPGLSVPLTYNITTAWLIKFRDPDEARLDLLNRMLAWMEEHPNGYAGSDGAGGTMSYTAEQIAARKITLEQERALLQGTVAARRLSRPPSLPSADPAARPAPHTLPPG